MDKTREKLLETLLETHNRLGVSQSDGYEKHRLYSIITNSTAIEGSTLTLAENTLMFDEGLTPQGKRVQEQLMNQDLKRAYDVAREIASARTRLSIPLLKSFSSLVMRNTGSIYNTQSGTYDEARGDFRLQDVSAGRGGHVYPSWEKVEVRTAEFVSWLNEQLGWLDIMPPSDIYELSFEAHYRLVTIHPWSDGNGRVSRLLMNLIQMEGCVVPSIVRSEYKAQYIGALAEAEIEGDSRPFLDFMTDELCEDLSQEIDAYAAKCKL